MVYLTRRVNEQLRALGQRTGSESRAVKDELAEAQLELENVKTAIKRGILTDTTTGDAPATDPRAALPGCGAIC